MNTLVLLQVPDHHLYRRLNAIASSNRRSMKLAILALAAGLPGEPPPQRPDVETSRHWLQRQIWNLPLQLPLLFVGNDFICTDLRAAL